MFAINISQTYHIHIRNISITVTISGNLRLVASHLTLCSSFIADCHLHMQHKSASRRLEPAKGKGGEKKLACKTGERTEAQKKADAKYLKRCVAGPLISFVLSLNHLCFFSVIRRR